MSLVRWDPFRNFDRRISRFFGPAGFDRWDRWDDAPTLTAWAPAVDVHEKDGSIHVTAELPGVDRKDIDVNLENNVLTLRGERRMESERDDKSYHWRERAFGAFQRSFTLPATVDRDKVKATFKDGVLEVVIPHRPEAKPRQISVEAA